MTLKKLKILKEAKERRQRRERKNNIIIKNKDLQPRKYEEIASKVKEILARVEFHKP